MTETDLIEQRLRRTFEAVAAQPVAPVFVGGGRRSGGGPGLSLRGTGLLITAVVALVVGVGAVALVYGPRSAGPGTASPPPVAAGHGGGIATFVTTSPTASARRRAEDARILTRRLAAFGDRPDKAVVKGRSVVVVGGRRLRVPAAVLASTGTVLFRPVLCVSAPQTPPAPGISAVPLPGSSSCSAAVYSLRGPNLTVNPSTGASNEESIGRDPALAATPSSTPSYDETHPQSPVLVPIEASGASAGGRGGGGRYLLGPAELSGTAVASATTSFHSTQWVVDVDFTGSGATQWDAVARKNFHEIIAVDLDGRVVAAPLVESNQTAFTSFDGRLEVGGNLTERSAQTLAAVLDSGPLATPLAPVTQKPVTQKPVTQKPATQKPATQKR